LMFGQRKKSQKKRFTVVDYGAGSKIKREVQPRRENTAPCFEGERGKPRRWALPHKSAEKKSNEPGRIAPLKTLGGIKHLKSDS